MYFDCWATLWQKPDPTDKPLPPELKRLASDMKETDATITRDTLEPIIRDAIAQHGAQLVELKEDFTRFSGSPKVAAVYFRMEATKEDATDVLNAIHASEEHPKIKARAL